MKSNRLALIILAVFSLNLSAIADEVNGELAPENTTEMQDTPMPDALPVGDLSGSIPESTAPAHDAKPKKKSKKNVKKAKKSKKDKKKKKTAKNKNKKKRHKNAA